MYQSPRKFIPLAYILNEVRLVAIGWVCPASLACPSCSIGYYPLNVFIVIGRQGLMAGPEVKYLALATAIAAATPKYLAPCKPGNKDQVIWLWYIKMLTIHLLMS